jgi:hypothetical protein
VRLDVVAQRLDLEPWERLVDDLDLLQGDDVGRGLLQPLEQRADASADAVDVPRRNPHQAAGCQS